MRIIFDSSDGYPEKNRCWDIYTTITETYRNRPERLRDWISTPKGNGYQALHLTVLGPDAQWVEVQIRSQRMNEIAEQGLAAHWRYKGNEVEEDRELTIWLDTIREVLNHPNSEGMEFLDTVHLSLHANDITTFTPKGRTITLPIQASVLDFAYAVHTDLGDRCIGAKVNHKVVPISQVLTNGDQVEILTSRSVRPEPSWLDFVTTAYAKVKIETALRRHQRELVTRGEELLEAALAETGRPLSSDIINKLTHLYRFDRPDTLLRHIGDGSFSLPQDLDAVLRGKSEGRLGRMSRAIGELFSSGRDKGAKGSTETEGQEHVDHSHRLELNEDGYGIRYRMAPCCHPIPGDDILGIEDSSGKVVVHRSSCPEATRYKTTQGDQLLAPVWGAQHSPLFETSIVIGGIDSRGLLNAITQVLLEDFKVSITAIQMAAKDGVFEGVISLRTLGVSQVEAICALLRRNEAIHEAYRLSELSERP